MTNDVLDEHIRRRPSVHQLCLGPFLQHAFPVCVDVLAVPLGSVGFNDVALLVGQYVSADLQQEIMVRHVDELREKGKHAFPAVALVWHSTQDADTHALVESASPSFTRARQALSWATGEGVTPVAYVILHTEGAAFQVMPPISRRRQRLWFGQEDVVQFERSVVRLSEAARADSNLGFALELFHDAMRESNDLFRIARLFNVLECLAARHKAGGVGSRDAVRTMLGIRPEPFCAIQHEGKEVRFDLIAIAGKLRDSILHGAMLAEDTFAASDRGVLPLLIQVPLYVANELQWRIEHEISLRAARHGEGDQAEPIRNFVCEA